MRLLDREECNIVAIQDPPQLRGRRRTFGQGGPRQLTQAEIAEKELERSDRRAIPATKSITPIVDLPNSLTASPNPQLHIKILISLWLVFFKMECLINIPGVKIRLLRQFSNLIR